MLHPRVKLNASHHNSNIISSSGTAAKDEIDVGTGGADDVKWTLRDITDFRTAACELTRDARESMAHVAKHGPHADAIITIPTECLSGIAITHICSIIAKAVMDVAFSPARMADLEHIHVDLLKLEKASSMMSMILLPSEEVAVAVGGPATTAGEPEEEQEQLLPSSFDDNGRFGALVFAGQLFNV